MYLCLLLCLCIAHSTPHPFAPAAADDFKRRPIYELTPHNFDILLNSNTCALIFVEGSENAAPPAVRTLAQQLARILRDHSDNLMLAHILSADLLQLPSLYTTETDGVVPPVWPPAAGKVDLMVLSSNSNGSRQPHIYQIDSDALHDILQWTLKKCGHNLLDLDVRLDLFEKAKIIDTAVASDSAQYAQLYAAEEAEDDARDLSVIFKTDQTQALLNQDFQADPEIKAWVREYCSDVKKKTQRPRRNWSSERRNITRMHVNDATFHRVYCEHVFAGEPFIITGAADDWPAVQHWGTNNTWSKVLNPRTTISVDNGLESSWGSKMSVADFQQYIATRAGNSSTTVEKRWNDALERPPWSSVYAYIHQHSKIYDGKFASDVMWNSLGAPKVLNENNWFQLMGACFKMMTVTFWAAHGARQSNHQDDFGSSKWQVQVYGRKKWIMHPPEQSSYLYNGLVDPFRPNVEKYPLYKHATPLEFILEQGDILFWSAGWWHATLAIEDSLAIAQNVLNEHNYGEFKRASQLACLPDGSHGIWSPWCACFRRCYSTWDQMYTTWTTHIQSGDATTFSPPNTNNMATCCDALEEDGISGVLKTHQKDVSNFRAFRGDYDALLASVEHELRGHVDTDL